MLRLTLLWLAWYCTKLAKRFLKRLSLKIRGVCLLEIKILHCTVVSILVALEVLEKVVVEDPALRLSLRLQASLLVSLFW